MVRILLFLGRRSWHYPFLVFCFLVVGSTLAFSTHIECDTSGRKVQCLVLDSTGYVLEIHRFKDGLKSGSWEKYNYNGQLIEKNFYKKDVRIWTFFYRDEEVIKSINKKGKVKKFKGCGCT